MTSAWIEHVKMMAKKLKLTYPQALKDHRTKESYHKMHGGKTHHKKHHMMHGMMHGGKVHHKKHHMMHGGKVHHKKHHIMHGAGFWKDFGHGFGNGFIGTANIAKGLYNQDTDTLEKGYKRLTAGKMHHKMPLLKEIKQMCKQHHIKLSSNGKPFNKKQLMQKLEHLMA